MANIISNDKSRRQDDKKEFRNKSLRSQTKTAMKNAEVKKDKVAVNVAIKLIDKTVTSGVFHKNKAARLKSKMHKIDVK